MSARLFKTELPGAYGCKPYARLNVQIGEDEEDLGTFIFRTSGFNSIRTLAARLAYYQAVSDNLLACLPLALRLRAKSTTMSHRAPIYYADITVREGRTVVETIVEAKELHERRVADGYDQAVFDVPTVRDSAAAHLKSW
jgi:hypothetical protein